MDLIKFTRERNDCYEAENGVILWKIIGKENFVPSVLSDEHGNVTTNILVWEGEIQIRYDGNLYVLTRNNFGYFIDKPEVELYSVSDNIKAYVLFGTDDYIVKLLKNNPPLPFSFMMMVRKNPKGTLTPDVTRLMLRRLDSMYEICLNEKHIFYNEMIRCAFRMFLMDIANAHIKDGGDEDNEAQSDRKKSFFIRFTKLLGAHVHREHTIGFYASELCITPQYLNRIVKELSGKTVYGWISYNLVGEISKRLETTDDTMHKIAQDLNFSNQSTMEKLFKRETGYTLTEFKKKFCKDG
ncbi:MAG: helix-turn-helix domain-containing protein [Prevotellaceae bacterium]|nr:helix-turn-helix domain-containing protein [Prevotellaceae bacterium]